jgi:hypothetical protein
MSRVDGGSASDRFPGSSISASSHGPELEIETATESDARFTTHLPVYSLAAASMSQGDASDSIRALGWARITIDRPLDKEMFIARVMSAAMEPTVPKGCYAVFRFLHDDSVEGPVVLVQSPHLSDPDSGAEFVVRRWRSEKQFFANGTWRHKRIELTPDNKGFQSIVFENVEPDLFRVVAELIYPVAQASGHQVLPHAPAR